LINPINLHRDGGGLQPGRPARRSGRVFTRARQFPFLWLALAITSLPLLSSSCSTTDQTEVTPLKIEGSTYVGDSACAECHEEITRAFPASPHARLRLARGGMAGQYGCESCHGPGSKHIAMSGRGGLDRFIINPGKDPQACLQCHIEVQAAFHLPQHHPVLEGQMNCVQCHDPHGMDIMKPAGGLAMGRLNESCAGCHREQTRPFVYEHPALREGCTVCHDAHGSINAEMLIEPDSNLCLRCHAEVAGPGASGHVYIGGRDHTASLAYGSCWSAGCHTAVHGSNVHPILLY
jgi:predicted CXXCH cytochrome family protein